MAKSKTLEKRIELLQSHITMERACIESFESDLRILSDEKDLDVENIKARCQSILNLRENISTYNKQWELLTAIRGEIE